MIPTPPRLRSAATEIRRIAKGMSPTDTQRLDQIADELDEMAKREENRQRMRQDVAGAEVKVPKGERK
jgi:hypothetical protein